MSKVFNKSKTYLLPLLYNVIDMDKKFFNYLENTYINDDLDEYKDCIFILHDFSFKNPEFTAYENKLVKNQYFVKLIDIDNQVLYIFKFPEDYMYEYYNFKEGKFSKFGNDAKILILEFFTDIYRGNNLAVEFLIKLKHIMFKDEKLKKKLEDELKVSLPDDAELADVPSIENETFNLSKYKHLIT